MTTYYIRKYKGFGGNAIVMMAPPDIAAITLDVADMWEPRA